MQTAQAPDYVRYVTPRIPITGMPLTSLLHHLVTTLEQSAQAVIVMIQEDSSQLAETVQDATARHRVYHAKL
jgi:hypothetical protein